MEGKLVNFVYVDANGIQTSRSVSVEREWETKDGKKMITGMDLIRGEYRSFRLNRVRLMSAVHGVM